MSLITLVYLIVVIVIYLGLYTLLGGGITTIIIAVTLLAQAILYTIKPHLYDQFIKYVNPKMYQALQEKDQVFTRKRGKMNTISLYMLSAIFVVNGLMQTFMGPNDLKTFFPTPKSLILFICIAIVVALVLIQISAKILRKSKTAEDEFAWSLLLGCGLAVLCIGGSVAYVLTQL